MTSIAGSTLNKRCKLEGCDRLGVRDAKGRHYLQRGYCPRHYIKLKKYGDVYHLSPRDPRPAIIEGDIAKIPLGVNAKHGYAIVDSKYAYLADEHMWTVNNCGYAKTDIVKEDGSRASFFLHHAVAGRPDKGMVTDHINRIPLDNRSANLRTVTHSVNSANSKRPSNNTSGYKNIWWHKLVNKWEVQIKRNGKSVFRNRYDKIEHAIIMRDIVTEIYDGKPHDLN